MLKKVKNRRPFVLEQFEQLLFLNGVVNITASSFGNAVAAGAHVRLSADNYAVYVGDHVADSKGKVAPFLNVTADPLIAELWDPTDKFYWGKINIPAANPTTADRSAVVTRMEPGIDNVQVFNGGINRTATNIPLNGQNELRLNINNPSGTGELIKIDALIGGAAYTTTTGINAGPTNSVSIFFSPTSAGPNSANLTLSVIGGDGTKTPTDEASKAIATVVPSVTLSISANAPVGSVVKVYTTGYVGTVGTQTVSGNNTLNFVGLLPTDSLNPKYVVELTGQNGDFYNSITLNHLSGSLSMPLARVEPRITKSSVMTLGRAVTSVAAKTLLEIGSTVENDSPSTQIVTAFATISLSGNTQVLSSSLAVKAGSTTNFVWLYTPQTSGTLTGSFQTKEDLGDPNNLTVTDTEPSQTLAKISSAPAQKAFSTGVRNVVFLPMYAAITSVGGTTQSAASIDFSGITDLVIWGVQLKQSSDGKYHGELDDSSTKNKIDLRTMQAIISAAHQQGVRVAFSIGEWETNSIFLSVINNSAYLSAFAKNVVSYAKQYGFDGINIDREPDDGGDTIAPATNTTLLTAISTAIKASTSPGLETSICVNAVHLDVDSSVNSLVAFVFPMVYDIRLGVPNNGPATFVDLKNALSLYKAAGVFPSLIVAGCPIYAQDGKNFSDTVSDAEIFAEFYKENGHYPAPNLDMVTLKPFTTSEGQTFGASNWYFNGINTILQKLRYILTNGYGGIGDWQGTGDHFNSVGGVDAFTILPTIEAAIPKTSDGAQKIINVIKSLDVEQNTRYQADANGTKCNVFASDVASAPTLQKSLSSSPGDAGILKADGQQAWLASSAGIAAGWTKIGTGSGAGQTAQTYANLGYLVLATWNSHTTEPGHIAVVRPSPNAYDSHKGPQIAQAGAKNYDTTTLNYGFLASQIPQIEYFAIWVG